MINWPTAFVVAVAIVAGAFLYQKPGAAQFGGGDGVALSGGANWAFHAVGEKIRMCVTDLDGDAEQFICTTWR